jgi:acylphosphatase
MDRLRAHVIIRGRVQGVNFRASAQAQARLHEVEGWVRNLDDGRVEAVFEGADAAVKRMISWCYSGPRSARIDDVNVEWEQPTGQERGFHIDW